MGEDKIKTKDLKVEKEVKSPSVKRLGAHGVLVDIINKIYKDNSEEINKLLTPNSTVSITINIA